MWLVDCWFSSTDADHTHSCQWAGLDQDTLSDSYHHMFGQISGKAWKQNTDQTKQVTKTKMNPDPRATELVDISVVAPQDPTSHQPTGRCNRIDWLRSLPFYWGFTEHLTVWGFFSDIFTVVSLQRLHPQTQGPHQVLICLDGQGLVSICVSTCGTFIH